MDPHRSTQVSDYHKGNLFYFQGKHVPNSFYSRTSIIRTFLWSQVGYDYLLVTIKIRSHVLFKTTALKGAVKCKGFLLSKSRGSARACRKVGLNKIGIFGFAVLAIF